MPINNVLLLNFIPIEFNQMVKSENLPDEGHNYFWQVINPTLKARERAGRRE